LKANLIVSNLTLSTWEYQFTRSQEYEWTDFADRSDTYVLLNKAFHKLDSNSKVHSDIFLRIV
jgi:hypothetical protein